MDNTSLKYELAAIKEIGENEAVVIASDKEYHILLNDEDARILEDLLLNESIEYVALDTESEKIIMDNVFGMDNENSQELTEINHGVNENGEAE